jgi:hypothetical protein
MKVKINFKEVDVHPELTYDQICDIAGKDPASVPTVVCSRSFGSTHVYPGDTIKLEDGASIIAVVTGNA